MGNRGIRHHRNVKKFLERRLQQREIQAAKYGISADPVINIEIEDLKNEIRSTEWKIARYTESLVETRNRQLSDIPSSTVKTNNDISSVRFDLNGKWMIEEIYEFGSTSGDVQIEQNGSHLSGVMSVRDSTDDGEVFIIQQHFSGTIRETTVFLYGESISTIGNMADDYELDQWVGIIKDNNTIEGNSEDLDGTSGEFIMKRLT